MEPRSSREGHQIGPPLLLQCADNRRASPEMGSGPLQMAAQEACPKELETREPLNPTSTTERGKAQHKSTDASTIPDLMFFDRACGAPRAMGPRGSVKEIRSAIILLQYFVKTDKRRRGAPAHRTKAAHCESGPQGRLPQATPSQMLKQWWL